MSSIRPSRSIGTVSPSGRCKVHEPAASVRLTRRTLARVPRTDAFCGEAARWRARPSQCATDIATRGKSTSTTVGWSNLARFGWLKMLDHAPVVHTQPAMARVHLPARMLLIQPQAERELPG